MRYRTLVLLLALPLIMSPASIPSVAASPGTLYQATWGGSNYDYGQAVTVDSAGNSYIAGYTWSFTPGTPSIFLLKYSFTGTLLMQKLWSDGAFNYAYGVAVDSSGNVYVTGWTNNLAGPSILLLKFNPSGGLVWQKTYAGGSHPSYGQAVTTDSSGSIYVAGYYASGPDQNASLLKFDPSGNLVWQRSWGGSNPEQEKGVAVDPSGNIYVTGSTNSFGAGAADVFLLKYGSTGGLLNQITWGGAGDDYANGVATDSMGNAYVTGSTLSVGLTSEAFLLKFSGAGTLLMRKLYGLTGATVANGVAVNSTTGEIWIAGSTIIGAYSEGMMLRLDSSGNSVSQMAWGGSGGSDTTYAVANDPSGNVIITGYVSEGDPYTFSNITGTLSDSNLNPANPIVQTSDPGFSIGFASGTLSMPPGSSQYAGGLDVFLSKFGTIPPISFSTSPSNSGSITFDGTVYGDGNTGSYVYGTYTATATPAPDYIFSSWTSTGSLSVSSRFSSSTQVIVTGPGTLTAGFVIATANITITISPDNTGTVTCNGLTYTGGQSFQIQVNSTLDCNANSYSGFQFVGWNGLSTSAAQSISFNVTEGGTLDASFTLTPTVTSLSPLGALLSSLITTTAILIRRRQNN